MPMRMPKTDKAAAAPNGAQSEWTGARERPDVVSRALRVAPESMFALECMSAARLSLREGCLFPESSGLVKSRLHKDGGVFFCADCRNFAAL